MKKYLNLIVLMCLLVNGGAYAKQGVVITIDVREQREVNTLIYTVPLLGTSYDGFSDTLKAKETGKFELKLELKQPSFIAIRESESSITRAKLLVEPGCSYHVSMDSQKKVQITGANEKGQMLYMTLLDRENPAMALLKNGMDVFNMSDTLSLTYVHHKINDLKQSDISKFKALLDEGAITKSFFDLVQKERGCYYASMEALFTCLKTYESIERGIQIDDLLQNMKEIITQYPPNDERLLLSSFWWDYTELYVKCDGHTQEPFKAEKTNEMLKNGTYNTYLLNESKKYLSGNVLEYFWARYIHSTCTSSGKSGSFEKEFISLIEQFEKDYPQSEYSKYLRPCIDEIIDYHQVYEQQFDNDVLFLEGYETFNTLEDVLKPLRGKKIYIDIWASWCVPCKEEFEHKETVKKILSENDAQMLYISIDFDNYDQEWKYRIKYHHLAGFHIRTNEVLYDHLRKRFGSNKSGTLSFGVPRYMLVDENGNIVNENAKSPSELVAGEKLF